MSKQTPPVRAIGLCPTIIKIVGRPGTGNLPKTIAPPDHPQNILKSINWLKGFCSFFSFFFISGGDLVQWSRNILAILVQGNETNISDELFEIGLLI